MKKLTKMFFIAAIFCATFFVTQATLAANWQSTTLDTTGDVGNYDTSLAVDSNNKIHISYFDNTNGDLKYITNTSGSWVSSAIDSSGTVGLYPSIAFDADDKVHISYYDGTNHFLKYATNATPTGVWQTYIIDNNDLGLWVVIDGATALAVDSDKKVHIGYLDETNDDLKYATNTSGTWQLSVVDSNIGGWFLAGGLSLAVDSNKKVHISYHETVGDDLKYTTNISGSWSPETVDSAGDVGMFSSIYLDANDKAHISYYDSTNGDLKYATNSSGAWQTTALDSNNNVGMGSSLKINSGSNIYISYYDVTNNDLKYINNISGSWQAFTLDSADSVGIYNSLAIDSNNKIHISYYDDTNDDLKYIYTLGPSSAALSVNSGAAYANSQNATLALSASGDPTQMVISENSDFSGASWEDYATSKTFTLSLSDGTKTVYAKFRDAWYVETDAISAQIILDTVGPTVTVKPKSNLYKHIKKVKLLVTDATSGVNKIYYTTNGSTPTTSSRAYSKPILISRDTVLKYFAVDNAGNQEAVKSTRYIIKKARTVTKSAKSSESLIKKKNTKFYANDLVFSYVLFPAKFKKTKYYYEFERFKKYPADFSEAAKNLLKKYWVVRTNSYLYKNTGHKVKMVFQYTNKEIKALRKKNHSAKEKNLELKFYNVQMAKWESAASAGKISRNLTKNTFTATASRFSSPSYTTAIGLK